MTSPLYSVSYNFYGILSTEKARLMATRVVTCKQCQKSFKSGIDAYHGSTPFVPKVDGVPSISKKDNIQQRVSE